jgi:hypothetical protein
MLALSTVLVIQEPNLLQGFAIPLARESASLRPRTRDDDSLRFSHHVAHAASPLIYRFLVILLCAAHHSMSGASCCVHAPGCRAAGNSGSLMERAESNPIASGSVRTRTENLPGTAWRREGCGNHRGCHRILAGAR